MNIYNRVVLVLGALSLLGYIFSENLLWPTRGPIRMFAILIATLLVAFALKGLGQKKEPDTKKDNGNDTERS
jgi:hypothetical protein